MEPIRSGRQHARSWYNFWMGASMFVANIQLASVEGEEVHWTRSNDANTDIDVGSYCNYITIWVSP